MPSSLGDNAYKGSLAANQRAAHVVVTAGLFSYSVNGPLHMCDMCAVLLNKDFLLSFILSFKLQCRQEFHCTHLHY